MALKVRNWDKFQHYKARRPPWIKLHRALLEDRAFLSLPLAAQALAPRLWLIASETDDGSLSPDPADLAFRLRCAEAELVPAVNALIAGKFLSGSLDAASATLAPCGQHADPEIETESEESRGEKETEQNATDERRSESQGFSVPMPELSEYGAAIVDEWHELRGSAFPQPSNRDFTTLSEWHAANIPLKVAIRGITDCFEGMRKRGDKGLGKPLAYYSSSVRQAYGQWRKAIA